MDTKYNYKVIEYTDKILSINSIKKEHTTSESLLCYLRDGWEIHHSEVVARDSFFYKMYVMRKKISETQISED